MAYNNYNNYNNNKTDDKYKSINEITNKIEKCNSLSSVLTTEEINIPNRSAYNVANELGNNLKTNQLRKIFEQIKYCERFLPNVEKSRSELYKTLPLIAYAVGRDNCPKEFFNLLNACINARVLKEEKDIKVLIEYVTSIVAYVKFFGTK